MPTFPTHELIDRLQATLRNQVQRTEQLMQLPLAVLTTAPGPKRWSVLEVIAHLNILGGHYHERLRKVYSDGVGFGKEDGFRSGYWGEKMTRTMQPKADGGIPWKMRTMARFEPRTVSSAPDELQRFHVLLVDLQRLLERARILGLEGPRITSTLGPIFRFKPGDAFRFTIAHQERHFLQIERTLAEIDR
ncbi:MAG TPA: DinB family protein [Flavobacteriales bacterium]